MNNLISRPNISATLPSDVSVLASEKCGTTFSFVLTAWTRYHTNLIHRVIELIWLCGFDPFDEQAGMDPDICADNEQIRCEVTAFGLTNSIVVELLAYQIGELTAADVETYTWDERK